MTAGPHGHRRIPTFPSLWRFQQRHSTQNIHGYNSIPNLRGPVVPTQWNQCNMLTFAKHLLVPQILKSYYTGLLPICVLSSTTEDEDLSMGYWGQDEDLSIGYWGKDEDLSMGIEGRMRTTPWGTEGRNEDLSIRYWGQDEDLSIWYCGFCLSQAFHWWLSWVLFFCCYCCCLLKYSSLHPQKHQYN